MSVQERERLQALVGLIDNIEVNPDVNVDYYIPGVMVTTDGYSEGHSYVQFAYASDGLEPHIHQVPLRQGYLEKAPEDLANLVTFSLERFMEEIDSRQYGAQ